MAAAEAEENEVALNLLDVGNKLLSPPSDVDELLKLLNLAKDFLTQLEQAPPVSMNIALYRIMKALVTKELLKHSEMDVKIALASCFSQIIYITAPVDPYNEDLMKDIFRLIVDALKNSDDLSGHTYDKKVSILETIAKVNSCVLMLDLDCNDLILEMFQHFLKTIRPANEGRVFSFMELIMTKLLDDCGDKLLPCLLDSLVKNIKDGSPIARRLGEKVIGNCAGKLKPYLTKLVRSKGASYNVYGDIIASVCQENYDISELNLPSTSGECLNYGMAELVDIPPKKTDATIDSEGKDLCRTSIKRSTRKSTEMGSLEHQKSKNEKLSGKITIIGDLAGEQSSKELNTDQCNLEKSSRTKSRRKRKRAVSEACEKELDEALVGSKIKVWWPADEEFYDGIVDSFDAVSKKHKISYFDGDEEILFLKDECWEFLEDNTKPDFLKRQQLENPRPDASPNVLNMVNGKNPMWEHCERVAGDARWKLRCLHCSKIISNVTRMKHHLAGTGKKSAQPCTHATPEVVKLFRDMVSEIRPSKYVTSSNMVNGKDPTWEHCERAGENAKWKLKCIHCSKIVSGVTRMKYHLARANTLSEPCTRCPLEVEKFFFNLISQLKP